MKITGLVLLALILLVVSLCGCGKSTDTQIDEPDTTKKSIIIDNTEPATEPEYNNVDTPVDGELNVYNISRDVFLEFIENPSIEVLNEKNRAVHSYPSEGDVMVAVTTHFTLTEDLISFVNKEAIQAYLSDNGYDVVVEDIVMFWEGNNNKSIWIDTAEQDFYITLGWDYSNDERIYEIYTADEYKAEFSRVEGKVIINGTELSGNSTAYIYHNYAEVPLLASLECYGASIISNDGNIAEFKLNGETFYLEFGSREFYRDGDERDNLFHQVDGGISYYYVNGNDMMVDDIVFRYIIENIMGVFPQVHIDRNDKVVEISDHDTSGMVGVRYFDLKEYAWTIGNDTYYKNVGPVETREVAVEKFLEVWDDRFGHIYPVNDNPVNVSYDAENECWLVNGSLNDPDDVVTYIYNSEDGTYEVYESTGEKYVTGSVVCALIQTDGTVLAVWLG